MRDLRECASSRRFGRGFFFSMSLSFYLYIEGMEFHFYQVGVRSVLEAGEGWKVVEYETAPTTDELERHAREWIKQNVDKIPPPGDPEDEEEAT